MRKHILFLLLLFANEYLLAQKEFQGEVTYKLHSNMEKLDAELNVLFAPARLKLRFKDYAKDKDQYDKEEIIVWLDSGKVYTVNTLSKSYKEKYLKPKKMTPKTGGKKIIGYNTTAFHVEGIDYNDALGMLSAASVIYYLPDSLYYTIPEKFRGNLELMMIQNNKIILGAEVRLKTSYETNAEKTDSTGNEDISAEAIKVEPRIFEGSVFAIPTDYENTTNFKYDATPDSLVAVVDSVANAASSPADSTSTQEKELKPTKNKPAKSPSSKNNMKSNAVKRKQ